MKMVVDGIVLASSSNDAQTAVENDIKSIMGEQSHRIEFNTTRATSNEIVAVNFDVILDEVDYEDFTVIAEEIHSHEDYSIEVLK